MPPFDPIASADHPDPLLGTIEPGGFISETPPDIEDFLNEIGFVGKAYMCIIKRAPTDGVVMKEFLPGSWKGTYLPIEELGKRFGPGQYFYCFSWQQKNAQGKLEKVYKEYKIYLGTEWDEINDEYMAEKWELREKKILALAQRKKMQDASRGILHGEEKKSDVDPIENLKKTMNVMKDIGVPIGMNGNNQESGSTNMLMLMMEIQRKSAETTMHLFMKMSEQSTNMMLAMMGNNRPQGTNEIFKEILGMVSNTINLKEALNPEKKTLVDKFFELAESVMPAILQIAKQPRAVREGNPLVNMVKNSADFNTMANDPAMLAEAIRKWDVAHGETQTNIILETVGLKRPSSPPATPTEPEPVSESDSAEFTSVNEDSEDEE